MTLEERVHQLRLGVMARAQELGNASQACREAGSSGTLFYRWRKRYLAHGSDGLHPRRHGARRGWSSRLSFQDGADNSDPGAGLADLGPCPAVQPTAPTPASRSHDCG
jgi:hypothetical protein